MSAGHREHHMQPAWRQWLARPAGPLVLLLPLAFALQLVATHVLINIYYPDETFQVAEIGHKLAFGYGITTWEWRDRIRSYIFPFVISLVMRLTAWMGHGSAGYLLGVSLFMALLFLGVVWFCYGWALRFSGRTAAVVAGLGASLWFFLIYMGSKTFSEVLSADVFLPALLLGVGGLRAEKANRGHLLAAGLLCGAAVGLRPQLLPTVIFAGWWLCRRNPQPLVLAFLGGAAISLAVFGIVDAFTLGYPFASVVRYFWVNLMEGRSKQFGVQPPYFFLAELGALCWPLLPFALLGLRRSPFLGGVLLVLIGSHSVLGHKELRFVYAAVPILVTLFGMGWVEASNLLRRRRFEGGSQAGTLAAAAAFVLLASGWGAKHFHHWQLQRGWIRVTDQLSRDPHVCGVAYYKTLWSYGPGYLHLHRPIPMYVVMDKKSLDELAPAANEMLIPFTVTSEAPSGFTRKECQGDACLFERPGTCARTAVPDLNTMIRETDQ